MRKYCKTGTVILLLLLTEMVYGAVYNTVANKLLQIQISNLGPTRITLETGKITDVFFYPEEAAKVILHKSGAVFVVPQASHKFVYLTVMGEKSYTQDLRLRFVFKQPDPILLATVKVTGKDNITTQVKVKGKRKK